MEGPFDMLWDQRQNAIAQPIDKYCGKCHGKMCIHPTYGDIYECSGCRVIFKDDRMSF